MSIIIISGRVAEAEAMARTLAESYSNEQNGGGGGGDSVSRKRKADESAAGSDDRMKRARAAAAAAAAPASASSAADAPVAALNGRIVSQPEAAAATAAKTIATPRQLVSQAIFSAVDCLPSVLASFCADYVIEPKSIDKAELIFELFKAQLHSQLFNAGIAPDRPSQQAEEKMKELQDKRIMFGIQGQPIDLSRIKFTPKAVPEIWTKVRELMPRIESMELTRRAAAEQLGISDAVLIGIINSLKRG